jgi:hypothetical protein
MVHDSIDVDSNVVGIRIVVRGVVPGIELNPNTGSNTPVANSFTKTANRTADCLNHEYDAIGTRLSISIKQWAAGIRDSKLKEGTEGCRIDCGAAENTASLARKGTSQSQNRSITSHHSVGMAIQHESCGV